MDTVNVKGRTDAGRGGIARGLPFWLDGCMVTTEQVAEFRAQLETTKKKLETEIGTLGKAPDFGSDSDHFEEAADEVEEYSTNLGVEQTARERRNDVVHALTKIEAGTYGTCEKCSAPLTLELLRIEPASRLCQSCKLATHRLS